jgi:3-hydroxyacyl-CoA dehydrogenase/enoyl-CoA hydratase/3-hydroxybutyryl-CoA epimerase
VQPKPGGTRWNATLPNDHNNAMQQTITRNSATTTAQPALRSVQSTLREDGICVLTFDRPGSSANVFDAATLSELAEELDRIEHQPQVKGLVFTSAKRSVFVAGLDLNALRENEPMEHVRSLIERGQAMMHCIAALPFPTVAAIHGAALGGGLELCLACDYRVAASDPVTCLGLPETQIGLLPAWGGSTRLPRLIGLPRALQIILDGKPLAPPQALECGLADEVAAAPDLLDAAIRWIVKGKRHHHRRFFSNNAISAARLAAKTHKEVLQKTRGHYPAPLKALEVVTQAVSRSVVEALALERNAILELIQTEACRNLIRLFFMQERAKKRSVPGVPAQTGSEKITRAAVVGAGTMGSGIAYWLSARQVEVTLRDITAEQVAKGMSNITKLYQDSVTRGIITDQEMSDQLARIHADSADGPLRNVDLVIEAAFEDLEVKKQIFRRLDELAPPNAILATNTSALPISDIADVTRRPHQVLGLHFFNPVHRMQLVEIVAARQTAPEILQRALRFTQLIGKLPVIVKDRPGFIANRLLTPYLNEAERLFEQGVPIKDLDEAMLNFGMPMGPIRLLDEIGLDVELQIAKTLEAAFGDRMKVPGCLRQMVQGGLLGRKSGHGFYTHGGTGRPAANPQADEFIRTKAAHDFSPEELQERMVFPIINEAARCLEEGVAESAEDIDFVMVKGIGFAPFRGGPLRYSDTLGAERLVGAMEHLVDSGAPHFAPCALLRTLAADGRRFYP